MSRKVFVTLALCVPLSIASPTPADGPPDAHDILEALENATRYYESATDPATIRLASRIINGLIDHVNQLTGGRTSEVFSPASRMLGEITVTVVDDPTRVSEWRNAVESVLAAIERAMEDGLLDRPRFVRGDSNTDGSVDVSDAVHLLHYLFIGGPEPRCDKASDANDDGQLDVSDAAAVLGFLFGGPITGSVSGTCDTDSTRDDLDCESYTACTSDQPISG